MEYTLEFFADMAQAGVDAIKYPSTTPELYAPIRYAMASGGKRLRPALALAVYAALSHRDPSEILNQALAVEMFHNFTLLHDDVMDRADVRRGRPTVHRKWNENAAILSGDTMLSMSYGMLADGAGERFTQIFDIFNRTAIEVYEGQQLDTDFEARNNVTVEEYLEMIRLKTSVLLACACRIGAVMAGAPADVCDTFYRYGEYLGLAFQLRDDWLDTFGDPAVFGKEIGGDIVNAKKTWLLITAMKERREDISTILAEDLEPAERVRQVTEVYVAQKLDSRCQKLAEKYSADAIAALEGLDIDVAAKHLFESLARGAASRTH